MKSFNQLFYSLSYGTAFGDYGYINYVRGDRSLENCGFYNSAFMLLATYRRGASQKLSVFLNLLL